MKQGKAGCYKKIGYLYCFETEPHRRLGHNTITARGENTENSAKVEERDEKHSEENSHLPGFC